jgi:hypothetical protein
VPLTIRLATGASRASPLAIESRVASVGWIADVGGRRESTASNARRGERRHFGDALGEPSTFGKPALGFTR